jgi:hypothetical protein
MNIEEKQQDSNDNTLEISEKLPELKDKKIMN